MSLSTYMYPATYVYSTAPLAISTITIRNRDIVISVKMFSNTYANITLNVQIPISKMHTTLLFCSRKHLELSYHRSINILVTLRHSICGHNSDNMQVRGCDCSTLIDLIPSIKTTLTSNILEFFSHINPFSKTPILLAFVVITCPLFFVHSHHEL